MNTNNPNLIICNNPNIPQNDSDLTLNLPTQKTILEGRNKIANSNINFNENMYNFNPQNTNFNQNYDCNKYGQFPNINDFPDQKNVSNLSK